ncbi:MAG: leucine-rich repeat domain-containing protein, partial [Lachnospiraceae bacterium]|nr:leucine-rich repeat domain-containing protein [Lachnospiraceae bacterium]
GTLVSLKNGMFGGDENLAEVVLEDGIERIEGSVFRDCSSLRSVSIPDSVTELGEGLFYGCTALEAVPLSAGIRRLQYKMFIDDPESLAMLEIPAGVEEIRRYALAGIRTVVVPENARYVSYLGTACRKILPPDDTGTLQTQLTLERIIYEETAEQWALLTAGLDPNDPVRTVPVLFRGSVPENE